MADPFRVSSSTNTCDPPPEFLTCDPSRPPAGTAAPCDPEVAECTDPRTGGPARSAPGRREACERGNVPGVAERQATRYRDVYERAEDRSRTCDPDRLRRILGRGSDNVCGNAGALRTDAPRVTVDQLARRQEYALGQQDIHAFFRIVLGYGGGQILEAGAHAAAHGLGGVAGHTLANALPPLRLALLIHDAVEVRDYLAERADFTQEQAEAMHSLQTEWARYRQDQNAESLAFVRDRSRTIEEGMALAQENHLDDPFVQRRLEDDPYLRLGVQLALAGPSAPSVEANRMVPERNASRPIDMYRP